MHYSYYIHNEKLISFFKFLALCTFNISFSQHIQRVQVGQFLRQFFSCLGDEQDFELSEESLSYNNIYKYKLLTSN